jgi:hypothetical protein
VTIWANRGSQMPARPPAQQMPTSSLFRMVAAASAGAELSVGPELDLVKAALLYGDKVTILSPVTTMLLRGEGLQHFSLRQLFELFRRFAPAKLPPDELAQFELGAIHVDRLLRILDRFGRSGHLLERAIKELLKPYLHPLSEVVADVASQAGIDQLARARREGLVEIENVDPGDEVDLLAFCLVAAQLAQNGQRQDNPYTDRLIETFVDRLATHLSSGRDYLLFDEPVANLTEAAIREGLFTPAPGPAGRSAQAMAASGLMGRLPTFPGARVDEVLDIRSELAPSLTEFRSAMVTISRNFTAKPWERDFEDELHDVWVETVQPALQRIETSVRDNHSLLKLAADATGVVKDAWSGLLIVGAGLLGHGDAFHALGGTGAVGAAAPVLQRLRDREADRSTVRMQPFYFLYKTERALERA